MMCLPIILTNNGREKYDENITIMQIKFLYIFEI